MSKKVKDEKDVIVDTLLRLIKARRNAHISPKMISEALPVGEVLPFNADIVAWMEEHPDIFSPVKRFIWNYDLIRLVGRIDIIDDKKNVHIYKKVKAMLK